MFWHVANYAQENPHPLRTRTVLALASTSFYSLQTLRVLKWGLLFDELRDITGNPKPNWWNNSASSLTSSLILLAL
jgi:hypothetical protein